MARHLQRNIDLGEGQILTLKYTWVVYVPLYAQLIITDDPAFTNVIWETNSTTSEIDVVSQDVTLAIDSSSLGVNAGTPAFGATLPTAGYFYALDFRQLVGDDNEFRVQGSLQILKAGGVVKKETFANISETFNLGNATLVITEVS